MAFILPPEHARCVSPLFPSMHTPRLKMNEEIIDIMKIIKQILAIATMLSVMTPGAFALPQKKDEKQQPKEPRVVVNKPKDGEKQSDKGEKKEDKGENKEGKKP